MMTRIAALLGKELADLRQNPGVFIPAVMTGLISLALPFFVAVIVPAFAGEQLSDSSDFEIAVEMYRQQPRTAHLDPEGAIQAWIFQQFLLLLVLAPVAGSMAVAAFSVVGEKLARTLEPLLATPLTTFELLTAKVLGSLLPALGLMLCCFALYALGIVTLARPGVVWILLTPQSLATAFVLGPLAALVALQLAICVSSRAHDARSAQQVGALVVLPLAGLFVSTLVGNVLLTPSTIAAIALGLVAINAGLAWLGIVLFERDTILTRWK